MNIEEYSPKWIRKKYTEGSNKRDEITDFLVLIEAIWKISNEEYQERIWVNHETQDIVDSFNDTTMYFTEDTEAVLKAHQAGTVKMTQNQREMLEKLYDMVDAFEGIDFLRYFESLPKNSEAYNTLKFLYEKYNANAVDLSQKFPEGGDKDIICDPRWHKIRDYAKLVYKEITGEEA